MTQQAAGQRFSLLHHIASSIDDVGPQVHKLPPLRSLLCAFPATVSCVQVSQSVRVQTSSDQPVSRTELYQSLLIHRLVLVEWSIDKR